MQESSLLPYSFHSGSRPLRAATNGQNLRVPGQWTLRMTLLSDIQIPMLRGYPHPPGPSDTSDTRMPWQPSAFQLLCYL